MATSFARKVLCTATVAACAWVGALSSAQAATVPARFDPTFGLSLAGKGYKGTATFQIADSCLSTALYPGATEGFIYSDYDCSGTGDGYQNADMALIGIDVTFYDSGTLATVGSVQFGPGSAFSSPSGYGAILGMYVKYNALTGKNDVVGVQTGLIGSETASGTLGAFWIQFGDLNPNLGGAAATPGDPEYHLPGMPELGESPGDLDDLSAAAFQKATMFNSVSGCTNVSSTGPSTSLCQSNSADVVIPEPGSLALVLGALVAGWSVRRQRRS